MPGESILIVRCTPEVVRFLSDSVLHLADYKIFEVENLAEAGFQISAGFPDLLILGVAAGETDSLAWITLLSERFPALPFIMLLNEGAGVQPLTALRMGAADYLRSPLEVTKVQKAVQRALLRRERLLQWSRLEASQDGGHLQERVNELEAVSRIGRALTASLDLDKVLASVIKASVDLTGAEEGTLLLLDENNGELYIRAAQNFNEDFVRTFRLPIRDTLAGQVLNTGKPLLLNQEQPQKIKTAYLVRTLIYVPLQVKDRRIGVLGVDKRNSGSPFQEHHLALVSALAEFAAIAIDNARLYARTEVERKKLDTILNEIEEGAIVVDQEGQLILVNRVARTAFNIEENGLINKPFSEIFQHPDLVDLFNEGQDSTPCRGEISLEDGRTFITQLTPIPGVGLALTMQDITHLKELDRIKSDFVNTVSHDLRSPLTAILGYVELIERVGPVNPQQLEFLRRVQFNVHHITALINNLLDLGRLEAGIDTRNEVVPLEAVIQFSLTELGGRLANKNQELVIDIAPDLPCVFGNPGRLIQMVNNLISNANVYTPVGGMIIVQAQAEAGQVILQVKDNGIGIPASEQPYIFDKFYRGSNIPSDTPGTGLGLPITKSIVKNHQGRIWVDSTIGQGTTFTVVLPVVDQDL